MKLFRYIWRGLFGPKCPRCDVRDFEWSPAKEKNRLTWDLKCNLCQGKYWKFKGSDDRLFKLKTEETFSNWCGEHLTAHEKEKMTNTFDGRAICPDCEHYPLCASPNHYKVPMMWSCTACGSEFDYRGEKGVVRLSDKSPNDNPPIPKLKVTPIPLEDKGFFLEGSL